LDLSISDDVFLCNEGGEKTPYIKVCIIIRQLHFLRQNEPKKKKKI